jgi:hypothetical protein
VLIGLRDADKADSLRFVLVTGGSQERLVVCTFAGEDGDALPVPCDQFIELQP